MAGRHLGQWRSSQRLSPLKDRDISRISKLNDLLDVCMKVPALAPCQAEFADYIYSVSIQRTTNTRFFRGEHGTGKT
jgi:hypothetical protein